MKSWLVPAIFVALFLVLIVRYAREPYRPVLPRAKRAGSSRTTASGGGAKSRDRSADSTRGADSTGAARGETPEAPPRQSPERTTARATGETWEAPETARPTSGPVTVIVFPGPDPEDGHTISILNAVDEAERYHGGRMSVIRPDESEAPSYGISVFPAVVMLSSEGVVLAKFEGKGAAVMQRLKWKLMHP